MVNPTDNSENTDEIRNELKSRFDPDNSVLEGVMSKIVEAQQTEELSDYSHWDDPKKLGDDLESFSRGYGLQAGWNTWIGIQKVDTSHLTFDSEE